LSFCTFSFGHCVVCSSSIYGFWLPLWYLQTLLVLLYFFFWPLFCLFFFDIRILITTLVSSSSSYLCYLYLFTYTGIRFPYQMLYFRLTVTRRVSLVEQELLTLPGHLSSVFSGVHVAQSLVFCLSSLPFLVRFVLLDLLLFSQTFYQIVVTLHLSWLITRLLTRVTRPVSLGHYPSVAHELTPGFWWGSCCSIFSFLCNVL
jgi:hypothetical protein